MRVPIDRAVLQACVAVALLAGVLAVSLLPPRPVTRAASGPSAPGLRVIHVRAVTGALGPLVATVVGGERAASPIVRGSEVLVDEGLAEGWIIVDDGIHAPAASGLGALTRESEVVLDAAEPLTVRIVDDEHVAIEGAEIRAKEEPWASALPPLRTGADGTATLERLPREALRLRLAATEHLTRFLDTTAFGADPVVLEALVEKTFEVRDAQGEPLRSATVWVGREEGVDPIVDALAAPGIVRLRLPRKTAVPVQIRTSNTCSPAGLLLRGDMPAPPRIVLHEGWFQPVRVRRPDGSPALAVVHYGDPDDLVWRPTVMSDEAGVVVIGPLCSLAVTVSAEAGDASASALARRDSPKELTLTVEPPARLRLYVRDDEDKPAAGVQVAVTVLDEKGATRASTGEEVSPVAGSTFVALGDLGVTRGPVATLAQLERDGFAQAGVGHPTTNADGELRITRLPPGRVTLAIRRAGYVPTTLGPVDLVAGEELVLRGRVSRASHLEGNVLDDRGFPQRGYVVRLADASGAMAETVTARDGHFSFDEARGAVLLSVRREGGGADLDEVALTLEPGTHTEHDLVVHIGMAKEYQVRALDSRGFPVEGASVALRPPGGLVRLADSKTARDGIATLQFPVGGTIEVSVRAQGFAPAAILLDAETPEAVVTLDPMEDRSLRILDDRRNAPIPGALVWVRGVIGDAALSALRTSDRAGIVHVPAVASAAVEYVVVAPDHGIQRGQLLPAERDGVVRLPPAVTFEGRVSGAEKAIEGATVAGEFLGRIDSGLGATRTDAEGRFRFSLAGATLRFLEVCAPGYRCRRVGPLHGDERRPVDLGSVTLEKGFSSALGDVGIEAKPSSSGLRVEMVFPGSKVAESTLRVGDVIVLLDGRAADLGQLAGPIGSAVVAEVEREGRRRRIALPRERVLR